MERVLETNTIENPKKTFSIDALHSIAENIHKRSLVMLFSDMLDNSDKSLEELLEVRKKLVRAKEMYAEIKNYETKLETAHYRNTTIRILDDLEPLTKYIIEHSGLDPKH